MMRRRSKYGNRKTVVDGITFDSAKEARVYAELKLRERSGDIRALKVQPRFRLDVNGVKICDYVGDFDFYDPVIQSRVVADAKGFRTPIYRLKKKLMKAIHNIDILEL
jgi:Protein of unknown function (DUF1064)